ncbi:Cytochrome P450, E-class, group I [Parasponia andersonii]|uniref:Cytochrome P450, E-class, group I n=1 Tax=Parasponia andersonii TaxID=3476 RepID=A0A2P5DP34_PARAD|nr:Cytochrome P450, E-class, group I [Parasponia andersonii]
MIKGVPEPSGALPIIGHLHLLRGQAPVARILGAMADKYGPVYSLRIGQHRVLVLSSWELVKECLTTNDRVFAYRPGLAMGKYIAYDGASFALSPYGHYWREIRKIADLHLLSSHRLELLEHVRVSEVDSFIKGLLHFPSHEHDDQVPLSELFEQMTFNLVVTLVAGKRFPASAFSDMTSEACRFMKAIKEASYLSGVFVCSDAIPWLECLDIQGHVNSMKRTFKEIDLVLGNWLEEHRRARDDDQYCNDNNNGGSTLGRDLMDRMLSSLAEDDVMLSGYSRDTAIKATALIIILTGTESIGITLTWVICLLLNNPNELKTAQEELDSHVGRDRWVQESDITNLKFLQAIVKETLRLYSPAPFTPREAREDCYVGGHHVPAGTRLIVNFWKLHRDPRVWTDPLEFRPQRFMTATNANISYKDQHFEYIPFSSGRRSCPGMTLVLLVVQLVVARLVQGFDMKTKDDLPVDMREGLSIALPKLNPLQVVLAPRLPLQLYECL